MEEIKVGEYVRTIDGYIEKVTEIDNNYVYSDGILSYQFQGDVEIPNSYEEKSKIVKHSPNIIDLVQEGDIIEWYSEIYIGYYGINEIINRFGSIGVYAEEFDAVIDLKNLTIKSVVTKEMFNQVKYEV